MPEKTIHETGAIGSTSPPDDLRAAVTAMMRAHRVPGLSLAAVGADGLRYAVGYGDADRAERRPATPETAYLWFSMTKIVTATAAMALSDAGSVDLDAPVRDHLPYLPPARGGAAPTVRQLLDHTSGLGNPMPLRWVHAADRPAPDPEALLRRLVTRRRAFRHEPGAQARYTNVGYLALGAVIEAAAGMPFEEYVDHAVLEPTGMSRTGFEYQPGASAATGYVAAPRPALPVLRAVLPRGIAGHRTGPYLSLNRFHVDGPAYGGLVGDVVDAGRFLTMHLRDGEVDGHRVLAPETARAMRDVSRSGTPFTHGLGWFREKGPADHVEHFGAGAGFWNVMRLYPARGIGVVLMSNGTARYDFEPVMDVIVPAA